MIPGNLRFLAFTERSLRDAGLLASFVEILESGQYAPTHFSFDDDHWFPYETAAFTHDVPAYCCDYSYALIARRQPPLYQAIVSTKSRGLNEFDFSFDGFQDEEAASHTFQLADDLANLLEPVFDMVCARGDEDGSAYRIGYDTLKLFEFLEAGPSLGVRNWYGSAVTTHLDGQGLADIKLADVARTDWGTRVDICPQPWLKSLRELAEAHATILHRLRGSGILGDYRSGASPQPGARWVVPKQPIGDLRPTSAEGELLEPLREAFVNGVTLTGVDLSDARLPRVDLEERRIKELLAVGAHMPGAIAERAWLPWAEFASANLRGADFSEATLGFANFAEADLHGAILRRANLSVAECCDCDLEEADLTEADLEGAVVTGARINRADLSKVRACHANFDHASLRQSILRGADFTEASLRSTDLTEADLTGGRFVGADFRGAILDGVKWSGAVVDGAIFDPDKGPTLDGLAT
jgi:uncharacterized protein YjbI with pentapeptide repeats